MEMKKVAEKIPRVGIPHLLQREMPHLLEKKIRKRRRRIRKANND
jgi:phage terminase Nu1 subunit (DNA packaging protein)